MANDSVWERFFARFSLLFCKHSLRGQSVVRSVRIINLIKCSLRSLCNVGITTAVLSVEFHNRDHVCLRNLHASRCLGISRHIAVKEERRTATGNGIAVVSCVNHIVVIACIALSTNSLAFFDGTLD